MAEPGGATSSYQLSNTVAEGFEDLSISHDGEDVEANEEEKFIDSIDSVRRVDFHSLNSEELVKYEFGDLDIAYAFYNLYGKVNGFGIRRHKVGRSVVDNSKLWQIFVCCRHGHRQPKHLEKVDRKKEPKPLTRCGCEAQLRVHVDRSSGRWYVSEFADEHNHDLLSPMFYGLSRSHSRMTDGQVVKMTSMRDAGISTPKIYGYFASQSGGYNKVGFRKKEMYNQIGKQREVGDGDAKAALAYLEKLSSVDPMMYWRHEVDDGGVLLHLFWADGRSRRDYEVFGDILAFDATYGRNKYKCPLVVFSGVNHHLQTIVFGSGIVSDETEGTYVWLLERFLEAMNGKGPKSVITDGDSSMKKAISIVFPDAHHRLCGWHLLRNATSHVSNPKFTQEFKKCMLGDYEVNEFEDKWKSMVKKFGVEEVGWVEEIYEKREMWATAHMRGKFFAGLRTTSRCEALHSQIGRYVQSGYSLREFLHHFKRCLGFLRNNEREADYKSLSGFPVMQTQLQVLERSAALVYSREVFYIFRSLLLKTSTVKVIAWKETASVVIFVVSKYCDPHKAWHVSYCPANKELRCSCGRMESFGIPCVHMINIMVFLDFDKLPESLILKRWTMKAKEGIVFDNGQQSTFEDNFYISRVVSMSNSWEDLTHIACRYLDDFNDVMDWVANKKAELLAKQEKGIPESQGAADLYRGIIKDPRRVRTKGCGRTSISASGKTKRVLRCSLCRGEGHNCRKCPERARDMENLILETDEEHESDDSAEWQDDQSEDDDLDCYKTLGDGVVDV